MRVGDIFKKYHQLIFYSTWLLLHLVQAFATELFDDEAYYWVYSNFPAWGYFDHPPMIAILIKAGYALLHNELGVRLLTVFLSTAALYITQSLIERKNDYLFYAICGSLALAQIGGMLAVPDAPLMFFVALFFYAYRMFVTKMTIVNTLLLGLIIALMFYTKYHAVLVLFFTVLSNPKLFRTYQLYVACFFALLLYMPHLVWQHNHGYPSLYFHLFDRSAAESRLWYTLEFVAGQILLAGPLVGWLLLAATILYKPVSATERALKFTFAGIYVFFFISTLRGKAEANWTIPSFIGLIVLSHQYLLQHQKMRKVLYRLLPVTIVLVFVARFVMMADLPPAWWIVKDEFHQNKAFVQQIKSKAHDNPVVFLDTYQKPSKYWFYSGDTAFDLNTPTYRRNNYNFWPLEHRYNGHAATVFGAYDDFFNDEFILRNGEKNGARFIPLYFSFSNVTIGNISSSQTTSDSVSITFTTTTPTHYLQLFKSAPYDTASVYLAVYNKEKVTSYIPSKMKVRNIDSAVQQHTVSFKMNRSGKYVCKLAISTCLPGRPSLNSPGFSVELK